MNTNTPYQKTCHALFFSAAVFVLLTIILLGWSREALAVDAVSVAEEGRALAQKVYDRPGGEDFSSKVMMLLHSDRSEPRQRLLYNYSKDKGNAERWSLLRFIEPADVGGTGLLTLDYSGDESAQWLYLPGLDRVRRISSSRKGGRFVGSDFYYEDLMDREVSMDSHRIVGHEKLAGVDCYLLESIPIDAGNSVYSKRLSWIHPELALTLRVDFFEGTSREPSKRLQAKKIKKVQGYWTVFDSTMYNLKSGHKTQLLTLDIKYNQGLPDDLFNHRSLADKTREIPFRP